jgi:hypothetical protein
MQQCVWGISATILGYAFHLLCTSDMYMQSHHCVQLLVITAAYLPHPVCCASTVITAT